MSKRLVDLNPTFVGSGGPGVTKDGQPVERREGVGISFDCPCGCEDPCFVYFENPLDGGPSRAGKAPAWQRTGESFENISLTPSIQRVGGCAWHGYLTDGVLKEC